MSFLEFWQNLPSLVSPAFNFLGFEIHFYSLAYIFGFLSVYFLGLRSIKKYRLPIAKKDFEDLLIGGFISIILGARLFYVVFYNLPYFLDNPLQIIWPFDSLGAFVGISGMSFHGGLTFAILYFLWKLTKLKVSVQDFQFAIVPFIPIALFLGRIANFLNGELYGRPTDSVLAMNFNGELRHPSALYEAFLEGLVLFLILNYLKHTRLRPWLAAFLVGFYVLFRFIVEFFREPDVQLGLFGIFSMGQILSIVVLALIFVLIKYKNIEDKKI